MLYTLHMGKYCGVLSRGSSVRTSSGHTLHSLGTLRILWYVCFDQASSALGLSELLKLPGHPCCSTSDMSCLRFPKTHMLLPPADSEKARWHLPWLWLCNISG
jgi:hypothetical protein